MNYQNVQKEFLVDRHFKEYYYMATACKYITRAVIGQYSGRIFP